MKTQALLWVQLVLAAMLMWTCFCRLTKTGPDTYREVRWAILFEGVAAGLVFLAPVLPILMPHEMHWAAWSTPVGVWIILLLSVTLVQLVTAKYWKHGQAPAQFQQGSKGGGAAFAMVLLALGFLSSGSTPAAAQQPEGRAQAAYMEVPQGGEMTCTADGGCIVFNMPAMEALERALQRCKQGGARPARTL